MMRGETVTNPVSRFVKEIPQELIDSRDVPRRTKQALSQTNGNVTSGNSLTRPVAIKRTGTNAAVKPFIAKATAFANLTKGSDISNAEAPDYGPGDRVSHMKFGQGTVISVEKGARDYEVSVDFDSAGVKKMFAGFAKLKKL